MKSFVIVWWWRDSQRELAAGRALWLRRGLRELTRESVMPCKFIALIYLFDSTFRSKLIAGGGGVGKLLNGGTKAGSTNLSLTCRKGAVKDPIAVSELPVGPTLVHNSTENHTMI